MEKHTMDVLNLLGVVIAFAALLIAWWTLIVTKQSVERARIDWAKEKWFDLYFKADQAYNALDEYQALHQGCNPAVCSPEQERDHNKLMDMFREACTMAAVFPKNPATDALFKSVNFTSVNDALSKERLKVLSDALDLLRQNALVNSDVLRIEPEKSELRNL
jgi:hypothetical protein